MSIGEGFSLESTIKNYGITGNTMIDSIILAQLVPIIFGWWSFFSRQIKLLLVYLFKFCFKNVRQKLFKSKKQNNLVFYAEVTKTDTKLYDFLLNEVLYNVEVKSDNNTGQYLEDLAGLVYKNNKKQKEDEDLFEYGYGYYYYDKIKSKVAYDIYVNNNSDDKKLSYNKSFRMEDSNEDITKSFIYKDFLIKLALTGQDTNSTTVRIYICSLKPGTKFSLIYFEDFLHQRFSIRNKIPYIQTIELKSRSISGRIYSIMNEVIDFDNNSLNMGNWIMDDHDIEPEIKKDKMISRVNVDVINKTGIVFDDSVESYMNKLKFNAIAVENNMNSLSSFNNIYRKYISSTTQHYSLTGYFHHNNMIVMLCTKSTSVTMYVISYERMAELDELQELIDGILTKKLSNKKTPKKKTKHPINIYKRIDGQWNAYETEPRTFDTIYLPKKTMEEISCEFVKFTQMRPLYKQYQIPYRKGILFYGPPGTGKTSLIKALAYEYQMNIYVINVNDSDINDDTISNILSSIGSSGSKILLFEDVDSAFSDKEMVKNEVKISDLIEDEAEEPKTPTTHNTTNKPDTKETNDVNIAYATLEKLAKQSNQSNKFLTYSGLLNALDGVLSGHEGVITVMTTNYIEKLGQAFLRPGRIDRKFKLAQCNDEQIYQMADNFIKQRLILMESALKKLKNEPQQGVFEVEHCEDNKKYLSSPYLEEQIVKFIKTITNEQGVSQYTPAQMQQYFIRNIENIDDIFSNVNNINESFDYTGEERKTIDTEKDIEIIQA